MSPIRVTMRRTFGSVRNSYATALAVAAFVAASAASFAFALAGADGVRVSLASVWALSVAPLTPVLAALLGMGVWSEELRSGRIALLLSAPVRERDLVLGKYFGVLNVFVISLALALVLTLVPLRFFAPALVASAGFADFLPAVSALLLQGALWCAMAVAASAHFSNGAAAAAFSVFVTVGLPRGLWAAVYAWSSAGRGRLGEMFLDAHVADIVSGLVPLGVLVGYVSVSALLLFIAVLRIAALRLGGGGARSLRFSSLTAVALALVLATLVVSLAMRLPVTIDLGLGGDELRFSERTRAVIADARGVVRATCFLSRKDARFRPTARFLRALKREAESLGGLRFDLCFADPNWDLGESERLIRLGARAGSVVFERGRRHVAVNVGEECGGERVVAAAILQLTTPSQRRTIYWTRGHGEFSHTAYGPRGMSDIARDLSLDGFRNAEIDLAGDTQIPADCALVVIAGARDDFSRVEARRLDSYLREGGRLLVLLDSAETGGVASMLPGWELRPVALPLVGARMLSDTDVIVSEFADHAITGSLRGSRIVLDQPIGFVASAASEASSGADRIGFSPLASVGGVCVAAAVERGALAGNDLSLRPSRIVAVGDSSFILNAQLAANASANRDFFHNCVAYLAGVDMAAGSGLEPGVLYSGLDREGRMRFLVVAAGAVPIAVFLLLALGIAGRRRRG